jgi:hypothetical protein
MEGSKIYEGGNRYTRCEGSRLVAPQIVPYPPQIASLVRAIELSAKENLLANATY